MTAPLPPRPPVPPLRLALTLEYGHVVGWFPVAAAGRVFLGARDGLRALDAETGDTLWHVSHDGHPLHASADHVFVRRLTEGRRLYALDVVEAATGGRLRTVLETPSLTHERAQDALLVGATSRPEDGVVAVAVDDGAERWRWRAGREWSARGLTLGAGVAYVTGADGTLLALDLADGRERWRATVADLPWDHPAGRQPGGFRGDPLPLGDHVVLRAFGGRVVAFARADGQRAWVHQRPDMEYAAGAGLGGRFYGLSYRGELDVLDVLDGRVEKTMNLAAKVAAAARERGVRGAGKAGLPTAPLLVSESHFFTGGENGSVFAFEWPRGRFAWTGRPKGAASTDYAGSRFQVAGHRLYYGDTARRLYGLESDR